MTLMVTQGTLTNAAEGRLVVDVGGGGGRALTAELSNYSITNLNTSATIGCTDANSDIDCACRIIGVVVQACYHAA